MLFYYIDKYPMFEILSQYCCGVKGYGQKKDLPQRGLEKGETIINLITHKLNSTQKVIMVEYKLDR